MALLHADQCALPSHEPGCFTADGKVLVRALVKAGTRLGLERPRLRRQLRDGILRRHRSELLALAARHGPCFAAVDYPEQETMATAPSLRRPPGQALTMADRLANLWSYLGERLRLQCLAAPSAWIVSSDDQHGTIRPMIRSPVPRGCLS